MPRPKSAAAADKAENIAALDFGTHAARLAIYQLTGHAPPRLLLKKRVVTHLGAVSQRGCLDRAGLRRALKAAADFSKIARRYRAHPIAVATAAVRESRDGKKFQRAFHRRTGIRLQIISGRREALLIYQALAAELPHNRLMAVLDIGGGSTEITIGSRQKIFTALSLPIGAVKLAGIFPRIAADTQIPGPLFDVTKQYLRAAFGARIAALRRYGAQTAIGVAGTAGALAACLRRHTDQANCAWPFARIQQVRRQLCRWPLSVRAKLPGVLPDRAALSIAGAAILEIIFEQMRLQTFRFSPRGLVDGLLAQAQKARTGYCRQTRAALSAAIPTLPCVCKKHQKQSSLT